MYTVLDIQSFLLNEYKDIVYPEIIFLREVIKTTIQNKDLHLLNIIYHNNIDIDKPINIEQLVCYKNHLKKLRLNNLSSKLLRDIRHAYKITKSYIYVIQLITIRKKLEFSKLLQRNFTINPLLMDINSDVIYMIINLI